MVAFAAVDPFAVGPSRFAAGPFPVALAYLASLVVVAYPALAYLAIILKKKDG